ncbi:hypothetical protein [Bacillus sp. NEB1478]|uniref:hypothetical protein n=1 Tax=Bacillus sp. NEB1478 TaxID=3073816 RepID=UPI002872E898|nr:hypothetical protein [Bacillus sp. NEB1478]WNB92186.1 hypothetical protein RGB74_00555 [Bacillus sp. NEB1478]
MKRTGFFILITSIMLSLFTGFTFSKPASAEEGDPGKILADYAGEIRETSPRADGIYHIDTPRSIEKMKELNINTYYYLVWHERTDWDDLRNEFLPAAKAAGINVVVYLVPPTESTGERKSYPYMTDYLAWSRAIAELSVQYSNLIGWAIDDFNHNLNTYTPEYMAQMKEISEAINPKLFFTPQMYTDSLTESFLQTRGEYIDGVVLAFRDGIYRNTQVYETAQAQIDSSFNLLSQYNLKLYWMLYASQLSRTPANPSADYVREVIQIALDNMKQGKVEGVITYVLKKNFEPEPDDDKSFNDKGYLNFFIGLGVPSTAGSYTQATQRVQVDRQAGSYLLTFQTMDHGPNVFGYHKKQLLIDGQVVWEQDTSEIVTDMLWDTVTVDLTPYLEGKSKADLTFRLYENKGVSNYWTYAGFDALESTGFSILNNNFTDSSEWEFSSNYAGIIGEILQYDEQRSLRAYENTTASYLTYALYLSIYGAQFEPEIKKELLFKAEKSMELYFSENNDAAIKELNNMKKKISGYTGEYLPENLAEKWNAMIDRLIQLYSSN